MKLHITSIAEAYQRCEDCLAHGRNKDKRTIGNNTWLVRGDDWFEIVLHSTSIMWIYKDRIKLFAGAWKTVTTKARLNDLLPSGYGIRQANGVWHLSVRKGVCNDQGERTNETQFIFQDGITLWADGRITGAGEPDELQAKNDLRKRINKYARKFADALVAGKVSPPSGGDCWHCSLRVSKPAQDAGRTMGEVSGSDHLLSHMEENYFVASLLVRAAENHPRGSWFLGRSIPLIWASNIPEEKRKELLAGWDGKRLKDDTRVILRRYLQRNLGLASK